MTGLIRPHGGDTLKPLYVDDPDTRRALEREASDLPSLTVGSAAAASAVMLAGGYFTPLTGFMDKADALSVAETMHTRDGLFWPVPVLNLADSPGAAGSAERIALRDPNVEDRPVIAVMDVAGVEELSDAEYGTIVRQTYGTADTGHPGVAAFVAAGRFVISGPIRVLNYSYFATDFPDTFMTATGIRERIAASGWNRVVAFQTRNPMHRAHEELCRMAMERLDADGLVIHMPLGRLKPGDIPAHVRDAAIRKMVELYFPADSAIVSGYGFDMLYAGPREALLHAVFRQNMGATHLVVGRDHAGAGSYYGPFDAQTIFDGIPQGSLEIGIFRADHTAYSKKLNKVVMMREAPDHTQDDFVILSGTGVREMLGAGIAPPVEFSRPEVARILIEHYRSPAAAPD